MKTAIVTLTIGKEYSRIWQDLCEASWRLYASRHGYEVIVIEKLLDTSSRATNRSPAWQKCLILDPSVAGNYERVIWIDADIVINPYAPAIEESVPLEKIGATDEMRQWTPEERQIILLRNSEKFGKGTILDQANQSYNDPHSYHKFWGLPARGNHIIQTGVMVLSPLHHRNILEHVYHTYEDKGGYLYNYEMRPLSFEIQERRLHHLIDSKFNSLLLHSYSRLYFCNNVTFSTLKQRIDFIKDELDHCYFLHFAGPKMFHSLIKKVVIGYEEFRPLSSSQIN